MDGDLFDDLPEAVPEQVPQQSRTQTQAEAQTATQARGAAAGNSSGVPLAELLRPATLDEVIGQKHLLGPDRPLRLAFESG